MRRKNGYAVIIVTLIMLAGLVFGGSFYFRGMRNSLWRQTVTDILEVTGQGSHAFEVYVGKGLEMLGVRAENFARFRSEERGAIMEALDFYEHGDTSFAVIDLTHGMIYFNSGSYQELSEDDLARYQALPESGIREPYPDEYSGRQMLGYYCRFHFADGAEGMVQKGYLRSEVAQEFSLSFYDNSGFSYIANREGDILIRSQHKNANKTFLNVFDVIELAGNQSEDLEAFKEGIADEKRGVVRFSIDGEEYIFAFVPVDGTDGWTIISIIPNSVIMNEANRVLKISQSILYMTAMLILVIGPFVLVVARYRRRVRATETEVLYREQLFGILANNTQDVFLMLSGADLAVEYVTPNVERVLGVSRESVMQDLKELRNADYKDGYTINYEDLQTIAREEPAVFETERIHRKTGEHRWFQETIYRASIDDNERLIIVIADRTAERNNEQALKDALDIANAANAAKSTFLSNMSHDIRTPMNAIVGLATLLKRDAELPEQVRTHARKITASSKRLLGLINDVLDMSKIESGTVTLNVDEINLADLVEEMYTIMHPQTNAKKQSFVIRVDEVQSEYLLGDQTRINQILINILSNASKYTPSGGNIEMTIRELPQANPNFAHIQFVVADNGIGMSEEYQKEIFQPFSREINSTTNKILGTGLGMAITKNLVDLMGGTIRINSRQNEGTTMIVDLELRIRQQEDDVDFWNQHEITRVLVVDDEEEVCLGVAGSLREVGVSTEYALDGQTAVKMAASASAEHRRFDLILLDWKMPGWTGLDTVRHMRQSVPEDTPIIVFTAYDWSDIEKECKSVGICSFLPKPFFLSSFKRCITNLKEDAAQGMPTRMTGQLKGRHILVAEDNDINAEIIKELLDMVGASCEVACDGKEALERFAASESGCFDLILMDVQMPVMNGYEATKAIRACAHPEASSIPIIAMTANAFADDVSEALNSGMDAHLAKPVEIEQLDRTLGEILKKRT